MIKDNVPFGSFDFDILANEWSDLPLPEWGVETPMGWSNEPLDDSTSSESDPNDIEEPQIINCPKCGHEFSILREKG